MRGRVIVRTEIITPMRQYLHAPHRLVTALEAWLVGRPSFGVVGLVMLARTQRKGPRWPRRRARILLRVCEALAEGKTMYEATTKGAEKDLAYGYLRPLAACVLATSDALGDDDPDDDGHGE